MGLVRTSVQKQMWVSLGAAKETTRHTRWIQAHMFKCLWQWKEMVREDGGFNTNIWLVRNFVFLVMFFRQMLRYLGKRKHLVLLGFGALSVWSLLLVGLESGGSIQSPGTFQLTWANLCSNPLSSIDNKVRVVPRSEKLVVWTMQDLHWCLTQPVLNAHSYFDSLCWSSTAKKSRIWRQLGDKARGGAPNADVENFDIGGQLHFQCVGKDPFIFRQAQSPGRADLHWNSSLDSQPVIAPMTQHSSVFTPVCCTFRIFCVLFKRFLWLVHWNWNWKNDFAAHTQLKRGGA